MVVAAFGTLRRRGSYWRCGAHLDGLHNTVRLEVRPNRSSAAGARGAGNQERGGSANRPIRGREIMVELVEHAAM